MATTPPPRMGATTEAEPPNPNGAPTKPGETESEAGHEFTLQVFPDGRMQVYHEVDGQEQERQDVPDIGQALKMVLDLYRANASQDDQEAFEAGYSADTEEPKAPARRQPMGMA